MGQGRRRTKKPANTRHETMLNADSATSWGEVTAFQVGDLDTARRRINVQGNAVVVGGAIIVGTPKSHKSRTVPCPSFLTDRLADESENKSKRDLLFGIPLRASQYPPA